MPVLFKRVYQKINAYLKAFYGKYAHNHSNSSTQVQLLLKPQTPVKIIWLKRIILAVICLYSIVASYGWYQNQQIINDFKKNISGVMGAKLNHSTSAGAVGYVQEQFSKQFTNLQSLFNIQSQKIEKAESALAIEKTSQNYLLSEIKKLRQENIELQKRLHFFEGSANGSLINSNEQKNSNIDNHSPSDFFKVTKSQATINEEAQNIASQNYISNPHLDFKNQPQKVLQIKAWLIQSNLKAFEQVQPQTLNAELELRYEVAGKMITDRYPELLTQNNLLKNNGANQISLFKNIELKAYRAWLLDVEIPKNAVVISTKLTFKHENQQVVLDLD